MDEKTLTETLLDPLRMAVVFQIIKAGAITAKDIAINLGVHRNSVYYHLKKLLDNKIISCREEPVPKRHLSQRVYTISDAFRALKQEQQKGQTTLSVSKKFLFLANLYETSALIMEAGAAVKKSSEGEFETFAKALPIFPETYLLNESQYKAIIEKAGELLQEIKEYSEANARLLFESRGKLISALPEQYFLAILPIPPLQPLREQSKAQSS